MNYTKTVKDKFARAVSEYNMLDTDSLTVAFSGGADSTVLLHLLTDYCKVRSIRLSAFHVNHMIRGEESDRDEEFCRRFCLDNSVEFHSVRIDIPAICLSQGIGTEECARNMRYNALEAYCSEHSVSRIATAHNADDNVETVIFNLTRGCSLSGACGIPPVRDNIVRPLIYCSKIEILGYANENSLSYVFDSTNDDTDYTRNHIRHKVIPELRKINASVTESFSRFTGSLRCDADYLNSLAKKHLDESDVFFLSELETPILHRVISMKFEQTTNCRLDSKHIHAVADLIRAKKNNTFISLPCRIQACIEKGTLTLRNEECSPDPYSFELVMGENPIESDGSVILLCSDEIYNKKYNISKQNLYKIFIHTSLDFDKINGALLVRSRKDGDAYVFGKMTRKLKKLFNDAKISVRQRDTLPIICDSQSILWVPGFRTADRVLPCSESSRVLHLIYFKT